MKYSITIFQNWGKSLPIFQKWPVTSFRINDQQKPNWKKNKKTYEETSTKVLCRITLWKLEKIVTIYSTVPWIFQCLLDSVSVWRPVSVKWCFPPPAQCSPAAIWPLGTCTLESHLSFVSSAVPPFRYSDRRKHKYIAIHTQPLQCWKLPWEEAKQKLILK